MIYNVPEKFEQTLAASLQTAILQLALVDTGALYDSIQVGIEIEAQATAVDIILLVYAEDYAKYLVEPFDILSVWQAQSAFENTIGDLLLDYLQTTLTPDNLANYESVNYNLRVLLNNNEWFYQG